MLPLSIIVFLVLSIGCGSLIFGAGPGASLAVHAVFILSVFGFVATCSLALTRAASSDLESEAPKADDRVRSTSRRPKQQASRSTRGNEERAPSDHPSDWKRR